MLGCLFLVSGIPFSDAAQRHARKGTCSLDIETVCVFGVKDFLIVTVVIGQSLDRLSRIVEWCPRPRSLLRWFHHFAFFSSLDGRKDGMNCLGKGFAGALQDGSTGPKREE